MRAALSDAAGARALCGRRVRYRGRSYIVADLLWEEGWMILQATDRDRVQNDSFGRPSRVVPDEVRLRLRNREGEPFPLWEELQPLD
ncbi:MAG: hypothetical protein D6682_00635 [Zetaproteobacteria bacterium]|nr:MAG: hypothetical protein D6682_00635 [Zetaproteobacteria bacterium]